MKSLIELSNKRFTVPPKARDIEATPTKCSKSTVQPIIKDQNSPRSKMSELFRNDN